MKVQLKNPGNSGFCTRWPSSCDSGMTTSLMGRCMQSSVGPSTALLSAKWWTRRNIRETVSADSILPLASLLYLYLNLVPCSSLCISASLTGLIPSHSTHFLPLQLTLPGPCSAIPYCTSNQLGKRNDRYHYGFFKASFLSSQHSCLKINALERAHNRCGKSYRQAVNR